MIVQTQARSVDAMVGDAIRKRRLAFGMSAHEIANRWEKSGSYLLLVEEGMMRPQASELSDMALLFHCKISDFFTDVINKT